MLGIDRFKRALATLAKGDPHWFLGHISGVVHVGANTGQERDLYAKHNLRVLWVEPIPSIFAELQRNIASLPKQSAINALLSDTDDKEYVFNISNNDGQSSSILDLGRHAEIWPDVIFTSSIKLKSKTLDTILENSKDNYRALILDTQGSELSVLKGATKFLQTLTFIRTEAADFESYKRCATVDDISSYLSKFHFSLVRKDKFAESPNGGSYFDVLYSRH